MARRTRRAARAGDEAGAAAPVTAAAEAVIADLRAVARGTHPRNTSLIGRYLKCEDWQQGAALVARAVAAHGRGSVRWPEGARTGGAGTSLAAPPGWLPPI